MQTNDFEIIFPVNEYNEVQKNNVVMNAAEDKQQDMEVEPPLKSVEKNPIN